MQTTAQETADTRITTQRLGFVDVLAAGWRHYSVNFVPILLIILCVNIPITIITNLVSTPGAAYITASGTGASLLASLVALLFGLVAIVSVLAIAKVVEDSVLGRKVSAGSALRHGLTRWPAALGSTILLFLLLMVIIVPIAILFSVAFGVVAVIAGAAMGSGGEILTGLLAFLGIFVIFVVIFVPVMAIMIYVSFYYYASSLRGQGPLAALRYSWNLVRGQALRVFGYEFGIGLLGGLVNLFALTFVFAAGILTAYVPGLDMPVRITVIVVQLISSIVGSLFTVMIIVFFLNLDYLKHPEPAVVPAVVPAEVPAVVPSETPPAIEAPQDTQGQ